MPITWYTGNVTDAINEAKSRQASLLIFVKDDDQYTKLYEEVLESLDTTEKWYVAISLKAFSDAHDQLKAIYKIVPVPSVLVIDWESGMVMERIAGPLFDEELQELFLDAIANRPPGKEAPKPIIEKAEAPKVAQVKTEERKVAEEPLPSTSIPTQAKIQFKLKSGVTQQATFKATDTLGLVRQHVKTIFQLKGKFDLAVPYPRRTLLDSEDDLTVLDLGLCPTSAMLVLPLEEGSVLPWSIFQTIGGFLQPILDFLRGLWQQIFGRPPNPPTGPAGGGKKNN